MYKYRRICQVVKFGWLHACQISKKEFDGKRRFHFFKDIISCYLKYGMWSNQYLKERFGELDRLKRKEIGKRYKDANHKREEWVKDFYDNRIFLAKWTKYEIEANACRRERRNVAYKKHYSMGEGCIVEYGVELSRQHHLDGSLRIGNHVVFAKKVFIDYSGEVSIDDDVRFAAGVSIESHHRDLEAFNKGLDINIPTKLHICKGAYVGTHAIILDSCNYIGKNARIGAGAVVTKDIPDYAVAVGVPAKVVKYINEERLSKQSS